MILSVLLMPGYSFGGQQTPSVKVQAAKIKGGAKIAVRLQSGEQIRGRMGQISDSGFNVEPLKAGKGMTRTIAFDQVESLRPVKSHIVIYIVVGVVTAGLIVGIIYAAALAELTHKL
ncbi:MAG: hypothetical protein LAP39_14160 [Acidobacteriia bacterium]|nr:hypothetical protein [Terriglobia bacterium]